MQFFNEKDRKECSCGNKYLIAPRRNLILKLLDDCDNYNNIKMYIEDKTLVHHKMWKIN